MKIAIGVGLATLAVYAATIYAGLRVRDLGMDAAPLKNYVGMEWQPPSLSAVAHDARGDSIRRGALLFDETPLYAADHTSSKMRCSDCHAAGGMQPYASPVVGVAALFPMFNERAGHVISLKDRIQECFVRSENGKPLDYDGATMTALVDYIEWLSTPQPGHQPFRGRGLVTLPALTPDPEHGKAIYAAQCAGCHGGDGQGRAPQFPPLWGRDSFNDGAGMYGVKKMAAFVQHNMPANRMGILTAQEAYDVAGFVHAQSRPAFDVAYKKY